MTEHILKIHPKPFADLESGAKTGEVRDCSDQDFKVGDSVRLIMVDETGNPAGKELARSITHIQRHYGLPDYLCVLSYGQPQRDPLGEAEERDRLIAYGRSCGLDEASTVCSRMAHEAYFPPGSRFKYFTPKTQTRLGNLLIEAANAIASLPDGPYDRFKAHQQKKAGASAVA